MVNVRIYHMFEAGNIVLVAGFLFAVCVPAT